MKFMRIGVLFALLSIISASGNAHKTIPSRKITVYNFMFTARVLIMKSHPRQYNYMTWPIIKRKYIKYSNDSDINSKYSYWPVVAYGDKGGVEISNEKLSIGGGEIYNIYRRGGKICIDGFSRKYENFRNVVPYYYMKSPSFVIKSGKC